MASLHAAHRGYAYQDLLVACKLVDVLLGTVVRVSVDEKLVPVDLFDDLTVIDAAGCRERSQIKHTDTEGRPLTVATFTGRSVLRLDSVVGSVLADRDGPGSSASGYSYRIVLRDTAPTDPCLTDVLVRASDDPGPFVEGMRSVRFVFDAEALWTQMGQHSSTGAGRSDHRFAFLGGGDVLLSRADLDWVCDRLVVEVQAPAFSGDLTKPAEAESLLLRRVREDVGAEIFPNAHRSAAGVARAMIEAAESARQGRGTVTDGELLRRAGLRVDFGGVSRRHPVDHSLEVERHSAVRRLTDLAAKAAETGGSVLVVGPPGQGKSWLCHQLLEGLGEC